MTVEEMVRKAKRYSALADKATSGPWVYGCLYRAAVNDGTHEDWIPPETIPFGKCAFCAYRDDLPLIKVEKDEKGRSYHVHLDKDEWGYIYSLETLGMVIKGNCGDEKGGIQRKEDATLVSVAPDMARLLAKMANILERLLDVERLAAIEHEQWMEWAKAVKDEVSPERRARWEKYFVPYEDLPDEVKEMDRKYARKVIEWIVGSEENFDVS